MQAAQREFYDLLVNDLDRHVLKSVKYNEEVAQAALQNAWLKIFMTAHTYDPALASVKTWAKKIGEQCAVDELRRLYVHKKRIVDIEQRRDDDEGSDEVSGLDGFSCPLPGPEEKLQGRQLQQVVADCIERLPNDGPNYQLAIRLALDNELSYKGMQDILQAQSPRYHDLNHERVRGWVRKAAQEMKACIQEKLGYHPGKGDSK
ncbi:sigma factor [Herbaspirillum lusitanum]|uniref:Sigma factor n=1 Tax=Herbaspirillum lusitanum TaxID=213312 RepID=A0ABW9A7G6_9BURK